MYLNYSGFTNVDDLRFSGETQYLAEWIRLPANKEELLALHGEKNSKAMEHTMKQWKKKILFLNG